MGVRKVNLFVIGASKCGTTYMHGLLGQHPDVFMSPVKEPRFFQREDLREGLRDYKSLFLGAAHERYLGESSPVYSETLAFPLTPENIFRYNPDARLIYIVRNPLERLRSVWMQAQSSGHWVDKGEYGLRMPLDYARAIYSYPPFLDACRYWTHIQNYRSFFAADSLCVISFEEFVLYPARVMRCLFSFLGVDDEVTLEFGEQKVNSRDTKKMYNPWPKRINDTLPESINQYLPRKLEKAMAQALHRLFTPPMTEALLGGNEVEAIRSDLAEEVSSTYQYMGIEGDPWRFFANENGST